MSVSYKSLTIILSLILVLLFVSCTPKAKTEKFDLPKDQASVKRGQILVHGLANCGFCHGGDQSLDKGSYYTANVGSLHAKSLRALGDASGYEILQALREGKFQGRKLSGEPHSGYEWLSDDDAISIATYLKSLPPIPDGSEVVDSNDSPYWISKFWTGVKRYFKDTDQRGVGYVPAIGQQHKKEYGNYIVDNVARCAKCHNGPAGFWGDEKYLGGGKELDIGGTTKVAPALLGENTISTWDQGEIVRYLKSAKSSQEGTTTCPLVGPNWYGKAGSEDLAAIATYLRSLKE